MPFCPKCRSEFRAGFERCEECDVALVQELTALPTRPSPPPNPSMSPVLRTTEFSEALAVQSLLDGQGIPSSLENENSAFFVPGIPTLAVPFLISVPSSDAPDASGILKEARDSRHSSPPSDRPARRHWLLAIALLVPGVAAGELYLGGTQSAAAAAGAWAVLAMGLILDLRDRRPDVVFPEPRLGLFFLLGAVISFGLVIMVYPLVDPKWQVQMTAKRMLGVVGPLEEAAKFLPVLLILGLKRSWRENPFAWVLAAASAGAGFGFTENFLKFDSYRWDAAGALIITSVGLAHAAWSGLIGLCCMMFPTRAGLLFGAIGGWACASLLHGLWNTLALEELEWINFSALVIVAIVYFCRLDRWLKAENDSPSSPSAPATPIR